MNCLCVIPSRYPSTRLPAKPLKDIGGKTLLQRVWGQAKKACCFSEVVIATDDDRILEHAKSFGATALMTSADNVTGSDRVSEVMRIYERQGKSFSFVANVQGDMPFINPKVIERTVDALAQSPLSVGMSTLATPILDEEEYLRPSAVKVSLGSDDMALYFSRSPIPHWRDRNPQEKVTEQNPFAYKHMGLYIFRPETLKLLPTLSQSFTETRERLEQLRLLAHGVRIKVAIVGQELVWPSIEIDTPEDLERANQVCAEFDRLR
jgi:3-deoxy-manno-octulosonate cytidylyltransferase (CMP-KDO synthetase)